MAKNLSACMQVVNELDARDERALMSRLDDLQQLEGLPPQQAQARAARELLADLTAERIRTEGVALSTPRRAPDTPEFKAWFGDSKVVDEQGRPLVVYHGTGADFSAFDTNAKPIHYLRDKGKVFFYGDPAAASEYAEGVAANVGGAANVRPVYLALQKPYEVTVEGHPSEEWDMAGGRFERESPAGTDGYIVRGIGYDDEPAVMYVAFRPEQIKSAIGNDGSYDPESADITRSTRRQSDPAKIFGQDLVPLAIAARDKLSVRARSAVDNWNVNWDSGALERAFRGDDKLAEVRAEIDAAFEPVRAKLRQIYGDTVPLFRGEHDWGKNDGPENPDRTLLSWTPLESTAALYARNGKRTVAPLTDEQVDKALKQFNDTGFLKLRGYMYLRTKDSPESYSIYDRDRQYLTDGDDIEQELRTRQQDLQAWNEDANDGGAIYSAEVPVDDIVWIPSGISGANFREPELIAKYNPRQRPAEELDLRMSTDRGMQRWAEAAMVGAPAGARVAVVADSLPHVSLQMAGLREQPVTIDAGALRHIVRRGHTEITPQVIGDLPRMLAEPRATIANTTYVDGRPVRQYQILADRRDDLGRPILVALRPYEAREGRMALQVNGVINLFGRDNSMRYVIDQMAKGNVVWMPENEIARVQRYLDVEVPLTGKAGSSADGSRATVATVPSDSAAVKFRRGDAGWRKDGVQVRIPAGALDAAEGVAFSPRRPQFYSQLQPAFDITSAMREQLQEDGMPLFSTRRDVTQSENFKRWFGDSKAVDEQGRPRVYYHGTSRDKSDFSQSRVLEGGAYFFTPDPKAADEFTRRLNSTGEVQPNIMPVYLAAKNPFDYDNPEHVDAVILQSIVDDGGSPTDSSMKFRRDSMLMPWDGESNWGHIHDDYGIDGIEHFVPQIKKLGFDSYYVKEAGVKNLAVFRPEQIKSAIGNDGYFDPYSSDITRSTARMRSMNVGFGYQVADLLDSSQKVSWWDRTVGTPYHLAQRHPNTFGRVYDAVQSFISDVSKYATRAADLAPSILPKLETLADIGKSPLSAEDVKALSGPIFQGTVAYARDAEGNAVKTDDVGSAGVVWTDKELAEMWKLDERQREIYREFRRATNKSIADMAITGMVRLAGADAEGVRGRMIAANRVDEAASILGDHLAELAARDNARANTLQNTARQVKEIADQARGLMARGYAPLQRFGRFTVYAPGLFENGYFELFESERDANRRARELRELFPDQEVTTGTMSQESWRLFKGVTPEALALFGEALGLDESAGDQESQVFQEYLKMAKSTRSAMRHLIERKGVAGYSEDVGRVLAGFVYSNARLSSQNLNAAEILKAAAEVPDGDLKDHAIKFTEYAQNPAEEAAQIRSLLFVNYIGGSVASALTNLTQSLTTTFPTLTMHFGIGKSGRALADATQVVRRGAGDDKDLADAMKRAELAGVTAPQEVHYLMAQAQGRAPLRSGDGTALGEVLARTNNGWSKAMLAWGKMFGWAEQVNRQVAFVAAYKLARERGEADPYAFAAKLVADTQYTMNKGNNPVWARGPVGATVFTFRKFMVMYLEGLARMWGNGPEGKKAFALSLAIMFVLAGTGGFPFADDLDDLIDGFAQRVLNKSWSTKQAKREFFASILGNAGADFIEGGVSSIAGFPIDISGRLGMGNVVPGSGFLTKKADYTRDALEVVGVGADFAKRMAGGAAALVQGDVRQAAVTAAPTALANAIQAADMWQMGFYRDQRGRKVIDTNEVEALFKAIGFQPKSVQRVQEATVTQQSLIAQNKIREREIADLWARGRIERKPELVAEAKAQMEAWNKSNPMSKIDIDAAQINKRVKQAMMEKAQRLEKTAPKEIRQSVREALQQ